MMFDDVRYRFVNDKGKTVRLQDARGYDAEVIGVRQVWEGRMIPTQVLEVTMRVTRGGQNVARDGRVIRGEG